MRISPAASAAVLALLAKALGVPKSSLTVLRGAAARDKLIGLPLQSPAMASAARPG